jgi:hypothetical protein
MDYSTTENFDDVDRHLDAMVTGMIEHLGGDDPMNTMILIVYADMFERSANELPDLGVPMLSLTLARAIQRLVTHERPR